MLQGLSVLAMVCLHLFDRDASGLFSPLLYAAGTPLSFYLAQLSDFCSFGFAFLSGWGHMAQFGKPDFYRQRLKGLLSVFVSCWAILILFSLLSIALGQGDMMPGSLSRFLLNALALENSYNGAWWYLFAYAVLVLICPILLNAVKKLHPGLILGVGFLIYCGAYYIRFRADTENWLLLKAGPLGLTLFEYLVGAVFFRIQGFTRLSRLWEKLPRALRASLAAAVLLLCLYCRTKLVPSLFAAPVSGLVIMSLFHLWKKPQWIQRAFLFAGKHSTNIWLTHMFSTARRSGISCISQSIPLLSMP